MAIGRMGTRAPHMMDTKNADATSTTERRGTRTLWVVLGALVMGGIGIGAAILVMRTGILHRFESPATQFWIFQLGTGVGYFLGGLGLAALSPGRTTREPMIAAALAFLAQTGYLWYSDWVAMTPRIFFAMLGLDGALAWFGAWIGERLTGAK